MNTAQFADGMFVDAALLTSAAAMPVSSLRSAVSTLHTPGFVGQGGIAITFAGLVATATFGSAFEGAVFGSGAVAQAYGTVAGSSTAAYTVSLASLVPASGTLEVYLVAQVIQIGQNPVAIPGPPVGHPDYDSTFVATSAYTELVDSLQVVATTTVPDNIVSLEMARMVLTAGSTAVTSFDQSYAVRAGAILSQNGEVLAADLGAGAAAANVGQLGGALTGALPNPGLAAGAASGNIGALGGDLTGTLPSPTIKANVALTGAPTVPTAGQGTNSGQIASTAFTVAAVSTETVRASAAEALKAPIANPTFTGTATTANLVVSTGSFEHGSTTVAQAAYIDFHSCGAANDYDFRLIGTGGTPGTSGAGTLTMIGATLSIATTTLTVPAPPAADNTNKAATTAFVATGVLAEQTRALAAEATIRPGRLIKRTLFAVGTTMWTPDPRTTFGTYRMVAGGGSGAGTAALAASATTACVSTGGGSGSYEEGEFVIDTTVANASISIAVVVGAGGAAPTAGQNNGNPGLATSFGNRSCPGGVAGVTAAAATPPFIVFANSSAGFPTGTSIGTGVSSFVPYFADPGGTPGDGFAMSVSNIRPGIGAKSVIGSGGSGANTEGRGAGGAGSATQPGGPATAGTGGGGGYVIINEYT